MLCQCKKMNAVSLDSLLFWLYETVINIVIGSLLRTYIKTNYRLFEHVQKI